MDQKIHLGIVGAGSWGPNLIRNFNNLDRCQIDYVVDSDEKARKKISSQYPQIEIKSKLSEILDDPKLQAVAIATSAPSHYELAQQVLSAGKDVYVEKPLTLKSDQSEKLNKLASDKNLIIMVGHLLMYHPGVIYLKQIIESGELGDIYYIYTTRVNLGKVRDQENALWSFAPHDLSIILYLLNETPTEVVSTGAAFLNRGVEDVVFTSLKFKSGKTAHVHVSWLDPHKIRKTTVVGSKKMAVFDDAAPGENLRIYDKGVDYQPGVADYQGSLTLRIGDIYIPKIPAGEPLKNECLHFLDCVQNRKNPKSDGINGLNVVKILQAATQSLRNHGKPINI